MGLAAVGHQKLIGPITAGHIFWTSSAIGRYVQRAEKMLRNPMNHERDKSKEPDCAGVAYRENLKIIN
jgi:hypothetical protein